MSANPSGQPPRQRSVPQAVTLMSSSSDEEDERIPDTPLPARPALDRSRPSANKRPFDVTPSRPSQQGKRQRSESRGRSRRRPGEDTPVEQGTRWRDPLVEVPNSSSDEDLIHRRLFASRARPSMAEREPAAKLHRRVAFSVAPEEMPVDETSQETSREATPDSEMEDVESDDHPPMSQVDLTLAAAAEDMQGEDADIPLVEQGTRFSEYSARLIKAHDVGLHRLLDTILDLEDMPCDRWVQLRMKSKACKFSDLRNALFEMLASFDPQVLKHFVHGDLPKKYVDLRRLRQKLDQLGRLERKEFCPSIYAQYLVNADGESPTVGTLGMILDQVELYYRGGPESNRLAAKVDTTIGRGTKWTAATAAEGKRRYLQSDAQVRNCRMFVRNVRDRIKDIHGDVRLERPLCEIGYASQPAARLKQHARHSSSNYLMNLTEAICRIHFNTYYIKQFTVFRLVHVHHGMYAEILGTRAALGYITEGGGFSHSRAGVSHVGIKEGPKSYWDGVQMECWTDPVFLARLKSEMDKMQHDGDTLVELEELAGHRANAKALLESAPGKLDTKFAQMEQLYKAVDETLQEPTIISMFLDFKLSDDEEEEEEEDTEMG